MKTVDLLNFEEKEKLIDIIKNELKSKLSDERAMHCISTMERAEEIAKDYEIDIQIVKLTALAHDIAKEMTIDEYESYAKDNKIYISEIDKDANAILHGIIGANMVKQKYGFTQEMQDAIYYHSTGRENMTLLDKIIFLADKSEKYREGVDADKLREVMQNEGLDKAILWDIDYYIIPRTIKKQKTIHPQSINTRNYIIKQIK